MVAHLFGNSPGPAVASYGLGATVDYGKDINPEEKAFVHRNFYIDVGLILLPDAKQEINLVTQTQLNLATAKLELNAVEVM